MRHIVSKLTALAAVTSLVTFSAAGGGLFIGKLIGTLGTAWKG